jgi:hypothetical protein
MEKIVDVSHLKISTEEPFIIVMAADPKPRHGINVHDAYGPVSKRHPYRPDIFRLVYALKAQRRMERVLRPKTVCFLCPFPDIRREFAIMIPERWQSC